MLLGLAASLGLDYKKPEEMTEAIDFFIEKIHPNVLQYTTDSATMQQLLRAGVVDAVGFWNSLGPHGVPERPDEYRVHDCQVGAIPGQRLHVDPEGTLRTRSWRRSSSTGV